jgi:hypothetical protein
MKSIFKRPLIALSVASVLLGFGVAASGETADALLRRYPFDPACPWGRIGNGKGLIVRCLSEAEAEALRSASALPASSAATVTPSASATPSALAPSPAPSEDPSENDASPSPVSGEKLDVTVGPVTADTGSFGIGKLGAPKNRYLKCINDNGGLKEATAEVEVRFLLRQRGRAEGVSVAKRVGLSAEAARCVSEVVDRRYVGIPDAPTVGATVAIKFAKAAK